MTKESLIDLMRRIKAHQAHISGKDNQKDFIALCDRAFDIMGDASIGNDAGCAGTPVTATTASAFTSSPTSDELPSLEDVRGIIPLSSEISVYDPDKLLHALGLWVVRHRLDATNLMMLDLLTSIRPYLRTTEPVSVSLKIAGDALLEKLKKDAGENGFVLHEENCLADCIDDARVCAKVWGLPYVD